MGAPFLHKLGQIIVIFRGFCKFFFRTTGFQIKFFILIEFPNISNWKPVVLSLGFFHILLREYHLKQKVAVIKPPEWKFMAMLARDAKFKGSQIIVRFWSKMKKKMVIFNNFTLISQS